ncbi:MAG: sporulation integral membrane protein YlbJ [Bacillota bacterium]|jgi:sporulation integral membrane protein YlbJ|nr:sporulation integral membrane protein YlbJ [Clostridia bacterium]
MKIFGALASVILCVSMLLFPKDTYEAATLGLATWWQIVFPSLMPFLILSELFLGLGVVHMVSILLEPVMRPIFNLPGCAAFVVALGYTSGFPVGAILTSRLRREKMVTRLEGERLISFTNNASPLFIFVAVAVGLFHRPALGIILAVAHYGANLTLGLALRFFGCQDPEKTREQVKCHNLLLNSIHAMIQAQKKDGRPIAKLISDAVRKSIQNLATIGGFIIFFAVIIRLMTLLGITNLLVKVLSLVFYPLGFPESLVNALSTGFFEMTLGAKLASESTASLAYQVIAASIIIAWSGISIHAQVAGMVAETDLRMLPFVLSRFVHAIFSGFFAYLLVQAQPVSAITPLAVSPVNTLWIILTSFILALASMLIPVCTAVLGFFLGKTAWLVLKIRR